MQNIILDFDSLTLEGELFENGIANQFYNNLPYNIDLVQWGSEIYGSIDINLGEENPVKEIPGGGLAYTNRGNYFCIFFGQNPAWPVEHIGSIIDDWKILNKKDSLNSVSIKVK